MPKLSPLDAAPRHLLKLDFPTSEAPLRAGAHSAGSPVVCLFTGHGGSVTAGTP